MPRAANCCDQCGDPVPTFTEEWLGNPVLYMGREPGRGYARKYAFCDADCLLDWLKEVLGE